MLSNRVSSASARQLCSLYDENSTDAVDGWIATRLKAGSPGASAAALAEKTILQLTRSIENGSTSWPDWLDGGFPR